MTLSFAEFRNRNLLRVLLSTTRGAETVVYLSRSSGRATLRAFIRPARTEEAPGGFQQATRLMEVIDVRISRDPTAAIDGVTLGGVEEPRLGDVILRSNEGGIRPYSLASVREKCVDSWLLRFTRPSTIQLGTARA